MNKLNKNLKRLKKSLADLETQQAQIQEQQEMLKSADAADLDDVDKAAELDSLAQIVAQHIAQTQAQAQYTRIYPGLVLKRRIRQNSYATLLYIAICMVAFVKMFSDPKHMSAYKTTGLVSVLFGVYHSQRTGQYYAKLRDFVNSQKYQR